MDSDHGELLGEHDLIGHDAFVYELPHRFHWLCMVCLHWRILLLVDIPFHICQSVSTLFFSQTENPIHVQREGEIYLDKDWNKLMYQLVFSLKLIPKNYIQKIVHKACKKMIDLMKHCLINLCLFHKKIVYPSEAALRSLGYVE